MYDHDISRQKVRLPGRNLYSIGKLVGWVGAICCLGLVFALADGLLAEMRRGPNRLDLLPGDTIPISGAIPALAAEKKDFVVRGLEEASGVHVELENFFESYWFGNGMWRAHVKIDDDVLKDTGEAVTREYLFAITFLNAPPRTAQPYYLVVWPDATVRQEGAFSVVERRLGWNPFHVAAGLAPVCLLIGVLSFVVGRRLTRCLHAAGIGEIVKFKRGKKEADGSMSPTLLYFTLGRVDGMFEGRRCLICRPDGRPVQEAVISACQPYSASLAVPSDSLAKGGDLVLPREQTPPAAPRFQGNARLSPLVKR